MSKVPAQAWFDRNTGRLQVTIEAPAAVAAGHWLELRHVNFRAVRPDGSWMETAISAPRNPAKRNTIRHAAGPDPAAAPMPEADFESIRDRALRGNPADGWGHATILRLTAEIDRLRAVEAGYEAEALNRLGEPGEQDDAEPADTDDGAEPDEQIDFSAIEDGCTHLDGYGMENCADAIRALDRSRDTALSKAERLERELAEANRTLAELAPTRLGTQVDGAGKAV